jgi:hypothetical protein
MAAASFGTFAIVANNPAPANLLASPRKAGCDHEFRNVSTLSKKISDDLCSIDST